jgi:hypothetical protein
MRKSLQEVFYEYLNLTRMIQVEMSLAMPHSKVNVEGGGGRSSW